MNFEIAKLGHSFKGAFAYYLHDKRADPAAPHLETSERVAWTETRNLAMDDPAYAQAVMIATAQNADQLKKAAGIKAGRKATAGPVYAYSLSWHPDKEAVPDRAGMMETVAETLRVLEAEHLQAVVICHDDTAHSHVHVVLNRVVPATGKMHDFGNDAHKLNAWAERYERERGQIVSPNRAAKFEQRRARTTRAFKEAATPKPEREKSRAAMLKEFAEAQKQQHRKEWVGLSAANRERRAAIYAQKVDFKAIAAQHRAEHRPLWSELGKQQAAAKRGFLDREKRLAGIVRNAVDVVRSQQIRGLAEDRGFLTMAFGYTMSAQARRAAFDAGQRAEKEKLAGSVNDALTAKFDALKADRAAKLAEARKVFDLERSQLIRRQDLEREKIRAAWRQLHAAAPARRYHPKARANDNQAQTRSTHDLADVPQQGKQPVKASFERSSQLAEGKQSAAPTKRVSVATAAPAPSPSGLPIPPARRMQDVPAVDPVKAAMQTPEGQKAAPDALRRSFRPAAAPNPEPPQANPAPDFWKQAAATPASPASSSARDFWKQAAQQSTGGKPEAQEVDRVRRPRR